MPAFEADALRLENDHLSWTRPWPDQRPLPPPRSPLSPRLWQDTRSHLLDEAAAFGRVRVDYLDREEANLRATAPRLLGVIQDRVWEPRFARLMAPLYQSTQD